MSTDACCALCGTYTEDPIKCQNQGCGVPCCSLCIVMTEEGDFCVDCAKKKEEGSE